MIIKSSSDNYINFNIYFDWLENMIVFRKQRSLILIFIHRQVNGIINYFVT